jgi:hypothetical protein
MVPTGIIKASIFLIKLNDGNLTNNESSNIPLMLFLNHYNSVRNARKKTNSRKLIHKEI